MDFFHPIITAVTHQLTTNQFFTGTVTAGILGGLAFALRSIPGKLWNLFLSIFSLELTINNDQDEFYSVNKYVLDKVLIRKLSRVFSVQSVWGKQSLNSNAPRAVGDTERQVLELTPGYGSHWGVWNGRLVRVTKSLNENSNSKDFKERLSVRVLTASRKVAQELLNDAQKYIDDKEASTTVTVFTNGSYSWNRMTVLRKRSFDTVFLPAGVAESLLGKVDKFLGSEQVYSDRGVPYHLGVFLSGKPGCGKSSAIHALASYLGRDVYFLNLNSVSSAAELVHLFSQASWERAIMAIEDIDGQTAALKSRTSDNTRGDQEVIDLSTVLNLLDGLISPHGMVVLATSNHPEMLDEALMRKSRFDLHLTLGELNWDQFLKMAAVYGHDPNVLCNSEKDYCPMVPADAKALLEGKDTAEILLEFSSTKNKSMLK